MLKIPPAAPERENKPPPPRKRFVMLDPLAIDKRLLYSVDGKFRIGLILEVDRGAAGQFAVTQATPGKLLKQGIKGKTVGHWHVLGHKWDQKDSKATGKKGGFA